MGINIIKGVGALFLVFVICFIANVALAVTNGTPSTPDLSVAFAWIGTAFVVFDDRTGFGRRFAASLLGSIASIIARLAFGAATGALLSTGVLTDAQGFLVIIGPFAVIANIGQLAVAYFVARAVAPLAVPDEAPSDKEAEIKRAKNVERMRLMRQSTKYREAEKVRDRASKRLISVHKFEQRGVVERCTELPC